MRPYLPALFILLSLSLFAQQKKADYAIGWPIEKMELHAISDKNKQRACTILLNGDSIKGFLMESQAGTREAFNLPRKTNERLLGGFFKANNFYLFLDNGLDSGLHCWVTDVAQGSAKEHILDYDYTRGKIIDRFSCGDHFLYYTADSKTAELIVHDFRSESQRTVTSYAFDKDMWKALTANKPHNRATNIKKVDFEGECDVDIAGVANKLYVHDDTLYLLNNSKPGITRCFIFNLATQQVSYKAITHTVVDNEWPLYFGDNSFFLKNRLYYAFARPDSLVISIYDFPSGNLVKTYKAMRDQDIPFRNTPIIQEGGGTIYSIGSTRELDNTRQLLRKIADDHAVLMATANNHGQVELAVGSHKKVKSGNTFIFARYAGFNPLLFVPVGVVYRPGWTKSARFKMLIDAHTGEHISGEMNKSINERIDDYNKSNNISTAAETLSVVENAYHYTYYDKKELKLCIVRF